MTHGFGNESAEPHETLEWMVRSSPGFIFVDSLPTPDPRAGKIERGDRVVLHPKGYPQDEEVSVRVDQPASDGPMSGVITYAPGAQAREDSRLARGTRVEFEERHVFRLAKAT